MKKLNIELKPILVSIGLVGFQSILYALSGLLNGDLHLIGNSIDDKIPFVIWFIIPYCLWYLMLFIVPYYIYKKDKTKFTKYCISYILITIVANIVFIAYPTTVARPNVTGNNPIDLLTRFIFWIDNPPQNCFPSLHCGVSALWLLYIISLKDCNKYFRVFTVIMSLLIMAATMFIKQHVFIDFVAGDIIAIVIVIIISYENKLTNKIKNILKI